MNTTLRILLSVSAAEAGLAPQNAAQEARQRKEPIADAPSSRAYRSTCRSRVSAPSLTHPAEGAPGSVFRRTAR